MRKSITEDILAVISYLLTLLLLQQRQKWRWTITEALSTTVASLITVLSHTMGGGAALSMLEHCVLDLMECSASVVCIPVGVQKRVKIVIIV